MQSTTTNTKCTWEEQNPSLKTRYRTIDLHKGILTSTANATEEPLGRTSSIRALGDYTLTKTLGSGSTGKVRLGIHRETGQKVAVKIVWRGEKPRTSASGREKKSKESQASRERRIMREAALLNVLHHPNIVQLHDLLVMPDFFALFFEHVEGGQMLDYIMAH